MQRRNSPNLLYKQNQILKLSEHALFQQGAFFQMKVLETKQCSQNNQYLYIIYESMHVQQGTKHYHIRI